MTISPDRKFVIVTYDPATPAQQTPIGKAGTIEQARNVLKSFESRTNGWLLAILAAPDWEMVS
jgi:hypothetical protein